MRDTPFERFLKVVEDSLSVCENCGLRDECLYFCEKEDEFENVEELPTCPEALFQFVMNGDFPLSVNKFVK